MFGNYIIYNMLQLKILKVLYMHQVQKIFMNINMNEH